MFNKYYYTKQGENVIIYEAKNVDGGVQMSLFQNEKLLDTQTGLLGEFELSGDNIKLKVKNSALKSTHELNYKNSIVELQKIKLKDLRRELSWHNIYNDINPTKAQEEAAAFDAKSLVVPLVLMVVGFIIQYFVRDMTKTYQLFAVVPEAIAGWLLFDIVSKRVSGLKNLRKGRIGFMAAVVVGLGLLGEFLFKFL